MHSTTGEMREIALRLANLHMSIPGICHHCCLLLCAACCCLRTHSCLQTSTGEMRARLGEVAHQRSDFVIVTNSSPRLEDPADIIQVRSRFRV
jgi:hypothetical protein